MSDYIKRSEAIVAMGCCFRAEEFARGEAIKWIKAVDSADVRETVRGEWKNFCDYDNVRGVNYNRWMCSNCGIIARIGWEHTREGRCPKYNFCPACGADMRKETAG